MGAKILISLLALGSSGKGCVRRDENMYMDTTTVHVLLLEWLFSHTCIELMHKNEVTGVDVNKFTPALHHTHWQPCHYYHSQRVLEFCNFLKISSQFKNMLVTLQFRGLLIPSNYAGKQIASSNLPSDQHPHNNAKVGTSWQAEYVQYLQSHPRIFTFKQAASITRLGSEAWSSDPGLKSDHEVRWRSWAVICL